MREKVKILGEGEGKTKLRGRETAETTVSLKNDLACLYLQLGTLSLLFTLFYFLSNE